MVQSEENRAMLGEMTNQLYNEQRDARTKRVNILREKRKFHETTTSLTKANQTNKHPSIILPSLSHSLVCNSTSESQS